MENDSQDKWLQKETGASMPVAMLNFQISTVLDKAMSYLKCGPGLLSLKLLDTIFDD